MDKPLKRALIISASVLIFLSTGATVNTVSARHRYYYRYSRRYIRKHYRRNRCRESSYKKRTKHTSHRRWRRIKRYRPGYFNYYGTWHKYHRRSKKSVPNVKKRRKVNKKIAFKPYKSTSKQDSNNETKSFASRRLTTYSAKVNTACNENFNDVNTDRESVGVGYIQRSSLLDKIAQKRSKQLVTNFSHYDSNGNLIAQNDLSKAGYDSNIWNGENIMDNSGYKLNGKESGDQANKQWWTDEKGTTSNRDGGHRKNIRNANFQSVGIGTTYVPSSDSWYMCQEFSNETPYQIDNGINSSNTSSNS